jgi:site-specific DNA recombinase
MDGVQVMTRVALYARYSDDKQSPFSIQDQFRVCRIHADKQDWTVVETYSDAAISGSTVILRPGVQALLRDALAGKFNLVLAEALDRLSRDQEDIAGLFKRLRFAGVPIITLSEGEISELHVGLKGTMNALFLKDLRDKTHRGIRGRVEAGKVGCGNAYGYKVLVIDEAGKLTTGEREIVPHEALIIRRIFEEYAAGKSPRCIAVDLNKDGIAAPRGAAHGPTPRSAATVPWALLSCRTSSTSVLWNRRRQMKNPDTARTEYRMNPQAEWVHVKAPHLRIIDDALWNAARARQASLIQTVERAKARGAEGLQAISGTRRPRNLLSGLLVCGVCGGNVAKRGNNRFGCVSHVMGRGCSNSRTIERDVLEARALAGLKDRLLAPEVIAEAIRTYVEETNRLNHQRRATREADTQRLEKARRGIASLVAAIEDGGYSRPLMERLKILEADAAALEQGLAEALLYVPDVHPNVAELYRRKIERLTEALNDPHDRTEAATALRGLIDRIVLTPGAKRGQIRAQLYGDLETALAWANDQGGQRRGAVGGYPGDALEVLSVSVGARAAVPGTHTRCQGCRAAAA